MNNKIDNLMPELRFPEFDKDWNTITLSDYCEIYRGSTFSKSDIDENGHTFSIHYGQLFTKYDEVILNVISKTNKQDGFKSKVGDILMPSSDVTPDGLAKASALMLDDVILGGDMNVLRPSSSVNPIFLSYLLNYSKNSIIKLVSGTTVKHIYPSQIINLQFPFIENLKEQQKIASCLSSLDEVICGYNDKLAFLKAQKKGLLQNLFPQEGEKVPKYRFKEFKEDGQWEEKKLGDKEVSFFVSDKVSISKLNIDSYISTENMLSEFLGVTTASKLPSSGSFTKFSIGDILTSNIRPYLKKVWKSNITGGASNDVIVFRCGSEVISDFLEFIIKNDDFIHYVMKSAKGVKMPRGDKNAMQKYAVFIPSKKEQQKIAFCLKLLDDLITEQIKKIKQLNLHKKGLMQGLFPIIN